MSGIAIKLGALLVRQITRPMANVLKRQAKNHAAFNEICIMLAQKMHVTDVILRSKLTPTKFRQPIRPLNDAKAVENGATLLSEAFVFTVTGSLVVWETLRQRQKELDRREQVRKDISTLQSEIEELRSTITAQNDELHSLRESIRQELATMKNRKHSKAPNTE